MKRFFIICGMLCSFALHGNFKQFNLDLERLLFGARSVDNLLGRGDVSFNEKVRIKQRTGEGILQSILVHHRKLGFQPD